MTRFWTNCRSVDPNEIESRVSVADNMEFLEQILSEEHSEEFQQRLERVRSIMQSLPPREADFVQLYFFDHKTQTDIAEIFRVRQPTVCYRLQRATARIRFMLEELPDIEEDELREALVGFLTDEEDIKIMLGMFATTCQSAVAHSMGITQGKVRHRFMRTRKRLEENPDMKKYANLFEVIANNLNMRREVERPIWDEKVRFVID